MPAIRDHLTERTLNKHLKKKHGLGARSANYIMSLKYSGDWILNRLDVVMLKDVFTHGLRLCGKTVCFRQAAVKRAILRSIAAGKISIFNLIMNSSLRPKTSLGPTMELVLALGDYIALNEQVPLFRQRLSGSGHQLFTKVANFYKKNASKAQRRNLLSTTCLYGRYKVMRYFISEGLTTDFYFNWKRSWRRSVTRIGLPIKTCISMYELLRMARADGHINGATEATETVSCYDIRCAVFRRSSSLLTTLKRLGPQTYSRAQKDLNDFTVTAAIGTPNRRITELPVIPFLKTLQTLGWDIFNENILQNAILKHDIPLVQWLTPQLGSITNQRWNRWIISTCRCESILCLQYFTGLGASLFSVEYLFQAFVHHSMQCIRWLFDNEPRFKSHKILHELQQKLSAGPWKRWIDSEKLLNDVKHSLPPAKLRSNHRSREFARMMETSQTTKNCVICFDKIDFSTVNVLECGHCFHNNCIAQCVKNECPTCRATFIRVYE